MNSICSVCNVFYKDGWEIENTPEEPNLDKFPEAYDLLIIYKANIGWNGETIYQCPECKALYLYHRSIPGGSLDAMKTYIVEKLIPITQEEANRLILKDKEKNQTVEAFLRCPSCKSTNVDLISSGTIGGEVFITYRCSNCGNEDTLDEYQLNDWYG